MGKCLHLMCGRAPSLGRGCGPEDRLPPEWLPVPWLGTPAATQAAGRPGSTSTLHSLCPIPALSGWVSEDGGSSREDWSVLVDKGLPGRASSEVSVSCSGLLGSLCAARGPPSGWHALLSASVERFSSQPGPRVPSYAPSLVQSVLGSIHLSRTTPLAPQPAFIAATMAQSSVSSAHSMQPGGGSVGMPA